MINSVTITNHLGESINIELANPEKSGFAILDMQGLGPCKADINIVELATIDGALYTSARVGSRNIVLSIKYLYNPTIEDSRQKSYKYFPIKKKIKMLFTTDNRNCEIYGYVESNDPNIFSNSEGSQISIICPDPYFYSAGALAKTLTLIAENKPSFSFPFSNESLTSNVIVFGEIENNKVESIVYDGDSEIGINITIRATGIVTNLSIYNVGSREVMSINNDRLVSLTGYGIVAGDEIFISTIKGSKHVILLRDGLYINILNSIARDSDWFTLTKGTNKFTFTAEYGSSNIAVYIENKTIYEGV